jgi:hypothetical protein
MLLFVPGRHHLLTQFQHDYLLMLATQGIEAAECVRSNDPEFVLEGSIDGVIFAITSSNHFGTRRNPIRFYLRALAVHEFGKTLPVPTHIYGINDVGVIDDFSAFTIKTVDHESGGRFDLSPDNTLIVCSTPVAESYLAEGYCVATAERGSNVTYEYVQTLPWELVEQIAMSSQDLDSPQIQRTVHSASLRVWKDNHVFNRSGWKCLTIWSSEA